MAARCERCSETVAAVFACLGRRLCFVCLRSVADLARGYASLDPIARRDLEDAVIEIERTAGRGARRRCARCRATGPTLPAAGGALCVACCREALAS